MATKNNAKRKRNSQSATKHSTRSKKGKTLTAAAAAAAAAAATTDSPDSTPRGHGKVLAKKDHDAAVAALQLVDWENVINTSRRNVIPDDAPRTKGILQGGKGKANKAFCHSFILGPNMKDPERRPSYWTESNPGLFDVLNSIMRKVDPDHEYTNITVNKNLRCKAHRDRGNVGMSYIVGFGGYRGGELMVGPRISANSSASSTEQTNKTKQLGRSVDKATRANAQAQTHASGPSKDEMDSAVEHDLHARFVSFYGGEQLHWTLPFVGDRYMGFD
jgi:hypothetical protein